MTTKIPIASVAFLRRWQRQHRRLVGSTPRRRHLFMARTLALAGMSPRQTAIVTAHQARVDATYCCDAVAEHVAEALRPALFATAVLGSGDGRPTVILGGHDGSDGDEAEAQLKAIGDGRPTVILGGHDGSDGDEAEAQLKAIGDGRPTVTPSRKMRNP